MAEDEEISHSIRIYPVMNVLRISKPKKQKFNYNIPYGFIKTTNISLSKEPINIIPNQIKKFASSEQKEFKKVDVVLKEIDTTTTTK